MRRKFTVYGLRFSKTTFWNRLNTGFLEPAVATALTACGIETSLHYYNNIIARYCCNGAYRLRYWNLSMIFHVPPFLLLVATALTACGIETCGDLQVYKICSKIVATALTACGIETFYFIMTQKNFWCSCNGAYRLRYWNRRLYESFETAYILELQRRLPLAVLKLLLW